MIPSRLGLVKHLNILSKWSWQNLMMINGKKCAIVPFGYKEEEPIQFRPHLDAAFTTIDYREEYKYLGLILRYNGRWSSHGESIIHKARRASWLVTRIIQCTGHPGIMNVCRLLRAIVYPVIAYGIPFWIPTAAHMKKLRSCLVQPLRIAMGLPRNCHYHSILIECNLPDIPELVHKCSLQVYRRLKKLPADHSIHEVFRNEGFLWKNDIATPKMYSIITKHVINAIEKTQLFGDLSSWTLDHITHALLSARKLNRLVNTLSFYRWRQEGHCKPLQSLLRFGYQGVSAYLKYDPFKVVKRPLAPRSYKIIG